MLLTYLMFYCIAIVYHIGVSSDVAMDVIVVMFKLLVLLYLRKRKTGESLHATNKHQKLQCDQNVRGFFAELRSKLPSTSTEININGVRSYSSFLSGTRSVGINKYQIQNGLQQFLATKTNGIATIGLNIPYELEVILTGKEQINGVKKYLDVLNTNLLRMIVAHMVSVGNTLTVMILIKKDMMVRIGRYGRHG